MAKVTKEQWERLARSVNLPEEEIQAAWQEVLEYRKEQAKKAGDFVLPTPEEDSQKS